MQERRSAQHSSRHTVILYLFEVSLLSELLLVLLCCGVCLFLCVCVCLWVFMCAGRSLAWHSGALVPLFPQLTVQSGRQVVPQSYLSHRLLSLSLPFLFASWYALSPAQGILFMPLKEKKRDISLLLQISCSETQLLLQVNRGLRHAEMLLARITCTAFNPKKISHWIFKL